MKNKPFYQRLNFAMSGFIAALKQENSIRFQVFTGLIVFILLALIQPSAIWWALIVVIVAMVLMAELFNTAIEELCDYVQPAQHEAIGKIKDIAAAAVLVVAVASVLVAFLLLFDQW